jgi:hypothetical protein
MIIVTQDKNNVIVQSPHPTTLREKKKRQRKSAKSKNVKKNKNKKARTTEMKRL